MSDDEIVGHKTYSDEHGHLRHKPLTKGEADSILAQIEQEEQKRKDLMPDEESAIRMMWGAQQRLKELGWNDAIYCPKDGTVFHAVEPGSTGIHRCKYKGTWPNGSFWVMSHGDMYPSRPTLFKLIEEES